MPAKSRKRSVKPGAPSNDAPRTSLATVLKWIGAVTAFISLTLGLVQVTKIAAEVQERRRFISETIVAAVQQQKSGDYETAWLSLDQAQKSADEGGELAKLIGHLDQERRQLRQTQEDLAMEWVRNARLAEGQHFADLVDKLLPVLVRGASSASGVRKADLLAHIGWAYFLKTRDTSANLDPATQYQQALALDPGNPYAHAHWGHWILWQRGSADEARRHFDAAVASGRELSYVRGIELAAWRNARSATSDGALLRVVNDMHNNHEKIYATIGSDVWNIYYSTFSESDDFGKLIAAVPAADQIALIQLLFYGPEFDPTKIPSREAYLAILEEAAGQRGEALKRWRALRAMLPADAAASLVTRTDAAIQRLSQPAKSTP